MKPTILFLLCALTLACGSHAFAAKEVFVRSKPHVNVGTLGVLDHGKTTLTTALARKADPSELETVRFRVDAPDSTGTFDLEALVAEVETDRAHHRVHDFDDDGTLLNLITGTVPMDGAILVVSAVDGPMPQTREHVLLARQVGVPSIVVFLNLDDGAAYQDQVDRAEHAVRELLSGAGYDGETTPVIHGSATGALRGHAEDLLALADLMDALDASLPRR